MYQIVCVVRLGVLVFMLLLPYCAEIMNLSTCVRVCVCGGGGRGGRVCVGGGWVGVGVCVWGGGGCERVCQYLLQTASHSGCGHNTLSVSVTDSTSFRLWSQHAVSICYRQHLIQAVVTTRCQYLLQTASHSGCGHNTLSASVTDSTSFRLGSQHAVSICYRQHLIQAVVTTRCQYLLQTAPHSGCGHNTLSVSVTDSTSFRLWSQHAVSICYRQQLIQAVVTTRCQYLLQTAPHSGWGHNTLSTCYRHLIQAVVVKLGHHVNQNVFTTRSQRLFQTTPVSGCGHNTLLTSVTDNT